MLDTQVLFGRNHRTGFQTRAPDVAGKIISELHCGGICGHSCGSFVPDPCQQVSGLCQTAPTCPTRQKTRPET